MQIETYVDYQSLMYFKSKDNLEPRQHKHPCIEHNCDSKSQISADLKPLWLGEEKT